ncbi:MAG: GldG family protein [Candidatus Hydrogenedentes bacterium]|nr:GldG family protein [Candidatus Hydrogenedentota bacterium]
MKHLRAIVGILALLSLAAAGNALVLREVFFIAPVLVPLALFGAFGLVWLGLTFTRLVNAYGRGRTFHGLNMVVSSLLFLGICVVGYAFTKHWGTPHDLTKEGRRALAQQTVQVLQALDKDVSVLCLFDKSTSAMGDITKEKTIRFLEQCGRYTPHLQVEVMDPQQELAKVKGLGIEQRLSPQGTVVLRCGARQRVIPLSGVTARLEERDFTNCLINVVRKSEPHIYFLTGHGEREITNTGAKDGGSILAASLAQESNKVDQLLISPTEPKVPADCDLLILAGLQKSDLQPREIQALQEYMDRGGRMLIMLDPWTVVVKGVQQLVPWLAQRFGVIVGEDLVWTPKDKAGPMLYLVKDIGLLGYDVPESEEVRGSFDVTHPVTRGFDMAMSFAGARSITLSTNSKDNVSGTVLLRALPDSWAETDLANWKTPNQDPGELSGRFGVAVAVIAKTDTPSGDSGQTREARLIVVGNSSFANNEQIAVSGNRNFILNSVAWLTENEELIAIRPVGSEPQPLLLTERQQKFVAWLAALGPVQLIAAAGLVVFILRRKYQ